MWPQRVHCSIQCSYPGREGVIRCTLVTRRQVSLSREISPPQLKQAIGQDVLAALEQQTGLSQEELLARLSRELPAAVDKYTPAGRLPDRNA
jgi:uncharacterized protein YidB (DUF937 family)